MGARRRDRTVPSVVAGAAIASCTLAAIVTWRRAHPSTAPKPTPSPLDVDLCRPSTHGGFPLLTLTTTKGDVVIELRPDLAPRSAARLRELAKAGYFDTKDVAFWRVNNWITQFGADESSARPQFDKLRKFTEADRDRNTCGVTPWERGTLALIGGNQMVVVLEPNEHMGKNELDAPAGYVVRGHDVLKSLHRYNDLIDNPAGGGPDQSKLQAPGGLSYLHSNFPNLDYILGASVDG